MSKQQWMYAAVGLALIGGYMWWKKSQQMKLSDIKKK